MEPPAENVEFLRRGLFCYLRLFGASVRRGFASPAWGLSSLLPFGHVIPPSGGVWDACAVRFRFLSLELKQLAALQARDSAVRRSWDACAASGKVGPVMGLRPLRGPPCIPPEAPPRALSITTGWRGHASYAAGASLTRGTRSGDLPPRRVNARVRFRFEQNPLQPSIIETVILKDFRY